MKEKQILSKFINKHDIEANWLKSSYIPKKGELIIYDVEIDEEGNILSLPTGRTEPILYARLKMGDSLTNVNSLPFITDAVQMQISTLILPLYTSEDEGKFLRIVNGVPAWTTITNAEEAKF